MKDRTEYHAEYRKQNKDKISSYYKKYYEKNKEKINALRKEKRKDPEHKAKRKTYHAEYHKNNPHKTRERRRRRRARIKNTFVIPYNESEVLETYGTNCHLCGLEIDLLAPRRPGSAEGWELGLHLDHYIPINMGGPDTLENIRPAHAKCNLDRSKHPPIQLVVQRREYK